MITNLWKYYLQWWFFFWYYYWFTRTLCEYGRHCEKHKKNYQYSSVDHLNF